MADRSRNRAERDAESIAELLYTDLNDSSNMSGLDPQPLRLDHCDLLLNTMDAQLGQLQVKSQKCEEIFRTRDSDAASFKWRQSLSKDTGLGSTTQTNDFPMCCLDLIHTPMVEETSERSTGCQGCTDIHEKTKNGLDRRTRVKEEIQSQREQVIWRLGMLLGDACKEDTITGETNPPSDSISTEDFVSRFREEMVELTWPEGNMQQLEKEDITEKTEIFDSDTCQTEQKGQSILNVRRKVSASPWKRSKDTVTGVPLRSFESVSIASDVDSVCPEHIHRRPGMDDSFTNQSDYNTPRQEEREPQSTSVHRSSYGNALNRSPICKTQHEKRQTYRFVSSLGDNDNNTDEEINHWSEGCRFDKKSKKMQEGWAKMKERLTYLQQKCKKEEETPRVKSTQLKDVEFCLSELQQRRKNLEETHEELQRAKEAENSLRKRCACLEEKHIQKKEHIEALEDQERELKFELGECKIQMGNLEKMLFQKELQLLDLQEQHGALQAERDGLRGELQHLISQQDKALNEAQEQAYRRMVNEQADKEKVNALKEQTLILTGCIESMQTSIQLKEEEAKKLRKSLEQQREEAKRREEELHVEASEKVHKAVEEERRKWEAEKVEALQVHCGILEEQNRKSLESRKSEMQQEKSKLAALQHQVLALKTRVQELESESCAQQREQESLLAVICKLLKEEHQAELQRLEKQLAQERQRAVLRSEQAVQLAEKEADRLRVMLEETVCSHSQMTAELDQQLRHWAQELGAECQHLHHLVEQHGAKQSALQLPASHTVTVAEALTNLRALREQLEHFISHLCQELDSQKKNTEQLRKDKEQELSMQRQQLRMEREEALDSLKERLIQEHIEELSGLNRAHIDNGGTEGGGLAAYLRKQLNTKDLELRQVQRNMGQWKEQTAAGLACKFEEELTAELERKTPKTRGGRQRKSERPDGGMTLGAKETQNSVCSPSLHVVDSAASHSPSDVASFKLLCYLQSRVKQLRLENQVYACSPAPPDTVYLNLSRSALTTITQGQDSTGIQSQSDIRTV